MNKKLKWVIILFIGIGLTLSILSFVSTRDKSLTTFIISVVQRNHYISPKIDDDFSKKVFDNFLKNVDYNKSFFYQSDIDRFEKYKYDIDDQIKDEDLVFFEEVYKTLDMRLKNIKIYVNKVLSRPFDFNKKEDFTIDAKKRKYSKNEAENKIFWHKFLKYKSLIRYYNLMIGDKKNKKKIINWDVMDSQKEKKAREKVKKYINRQFHRMLNEERPERINVFINSFLGVLDPHTNYFPPIQKEDFDIDMSGKLEGIGAQLTEADGYIKVVSIIPGGAAWKQKQLKAEDKIIKVAQAGGEPVDLIDARVSDAVKLIRGKKGTEVRLTVQKPDGRIMIIPIIREVIILEESFAKSVILYHRKLKKNFGYIYLPKFYSDFQARQQGRVGRRSSTDIKKEIMKITKNRKVQGIILDLRKNGGGALGDAIQMSGLFIEDGPIVQVKSRVGLFGQRKTNVYPDPDPSIVYSGNLIVMIDSLSASASEILAAAMQDYERAVIVGSNSFGKGTVQSFYEFNLSNLYPELGPQKTGAIKYTIQKFYRVNGGSTQYKGVVPDIQLPSLFDYLKIGEKELDYSLKYDKTNVLTYKHFKKKWDVKNLKMKSLQRVKNNEAYSFLKKHIATLKKQRDITKESLNFVRFMHKQKRYRDESKKFEEYFKENKNIVIVPYKNRKKLLKEKKEILKDWYKTLRKDIQLNEALYILNDM